MIVSVFVRRLKPGATFQDFVRVGGVPGNCDPGLSAWRLSGPRGWVAPSPAVG